MRDIAKKLGVSTSTVSLALANSPLISAETLKKVKEVARALKYKPNATMSSVMSKIRSGESGDSGETIAIFNARTSLVEKGSALEQYFDGAIAQAKRMGYVPLFIDLHSPDNPPHKISQILKARGIRGGVIAGHYREESLPPAILKVIRRIELVAIGIKGKSPINTSVVLDRFQFTNSYTRRICALGFKRVGFVIERFADSYEEGKLVGGFLRAQVELKSSIVPPFFWRYSGGNIHRLKEYVKEYSIDALLSYSTLVSRELVKCESQLDGVNVFHADNAVFKNDAIGGVKNRPQVGATGVKILSEILRGRLRNRVDNNVYVHSVPPVWDI